MAKRWTDQDETWHAGRPRPWPHCVRWLLTSPPIKGHSPPQFSTHICCGQMAAWIKMLPGMEPAHFYCGQTALCIKMPLGKEVGLNPEDFVFDADSVPSPKKGAKPLPNFRPMSIAANGCMVQDATWYRGMPLPRRHCVRWGPSSALPKKGTEPPPQFSAHVYCHLWPNCWIYQGGTWHGGGPWSRPHCARWGHSSLPKKGTEPPIFGACLLWPNGWMN